ncbi:MAG: Mini-ribonuclease 3 [Candidatus Izimaplasma sp.]|nr:Mini-ribonuclease 3 [Candidatus Izimaplasma bacterium]
MLQLSGQQLAYIGDAVFEVYVRKYLIKHKPSTVNMLHQNAIYFTSATGQERAFHLIEEHLTKEELRTFKRGRNSNAKSKPKNASVKTYNTATGFESLVGNLYLTKKEARLNELLSIIFDASAN